MLSLLLVLMASIGPRLAIATPVDLWQDFPDYQGQNGFFADGYVAATDTYQLLSGASFYYRQVAGYRTNPAIFQVAEGYIGYPWIAMFPSGTANPTDLAEDAVLAYTVPATANYQLNGAFYIASQYATHLDAYIKYNSTTLWASEPSSSPVHPFNVAALVLNAGDTLYFGIGAHPDYVMNDLNGASFLTGQINITPLVVAPEPATLLLVGTGLAGLAGSRRRRTKRATGVISVLSSIDPASLSSDFAMLTGTGLPSSIRPMDDSQQSRT